jgi:hypothetical protein
MLEMTRRIKLLMKKVALLMTNSLLLLSNPRMQQMLLEP